MLVYKNDYFIKKITIIKRCGQDEKHAEDNLEFEPQQTFLKSVIRRR